MRRSERSLSIFQIGQIGLLILLLVMSPACAEGEEESSSSVQIMERIETLIYGEPNKGGLIERLNNLERELFGRSLPGSIAERHSAILNFLEVGSEQPSMLFKLGVAEWIVGQRIEGTKAALRRLEILEKDLDGDLQYGRPVAMRVERLLGLLVSEPVTFQDVAVPGETILKVRFMEELSPAKSKKGDQVKLELAEDLMIDGCLVAPQGCRVETLVREVKKPRAFGVPGEVRLSFSELVPLGPQHPMVAVGEAAKKAAEAALKRRDKGEGAIIGAGAVSLAGAALLGPVGLVGGLFIRGNSINIPAGTLTFLQTSGDIVVSSYPVPESLRIDPKSAIRQSVEQGQGQGGSFSESGSDDTLELPPEQPIR
ncbi:MAG: hypothetical protein GX256_09280 [Fretibacterium sp.]|nr:hypothetical protein [Fretibacterium sp.]